MVTKPTPNPDPLPPRERDVPALIEQLDRLIESKLWPPPSQLRQFRDALTAQAEQIARLEAELTFAQTCLDIDAICSACGHRAGLHASDPPACVSDDCDCKVYVTADRDAQVRAARTESFRAGFDEAALDAYGEAREHVPFEDTNEANEAREEALTQHLATLAPAVGGSRE